MSDDPRVEIAARALCWAQGVHPYSGASPEDPRLNWQRASRAARMVLEALDAHAVWHAVSGAVEASPAATGAAKGSE